jgi:rhodanese-related sulfurtransferase
MVDEYQVLADYLAGRLADWTPTISADALYENLTDGDESNDPLIISVRAPEIYAVGHIQGAVNIPWKTIADPDNLAKLPMDRQIVVYCYTGHTGQVAATLLMSFGYDVTNLKFGMMGWSNDPDVVGTTPFSEAPGYPTETEAHELTGSYDPPVLDTGESDGAAIAIARAQQFLADWSPTISAEAVYENLTDGDDSNNPFLISVRAPDIYAVGHVQGAVDIPWKSIADTSLLAGVPSDQPIVDYCYTGHTGQVAATILKLLGYDVQNMKFGMMGWSNDLDVVGTTPFSAAPGYPTETEAHTLPEKTMRVVGRDSCPLPHGRFHEENVAPPGSRSGSAHPAAVLVYQRYRGHDDVDGGHDDRAGAFGAGLRHQGQQQLRRLSHRPGVAPGDGRRTGGGEPQRR